MNYNFLVALMTALVVQTYFVSVTAEDPTTATPMKCNLPMCEVLNCTKSYTPTPPANECPGCPICCEPLPCPAVKCQHGSTISDQANGCPGCPVCNECPNLQLICPRIVCPGGIIKKYAANGCEMCPTCLQSKPVETTY